MTRRALLLGIQDVDERMMSHAKANCTDVFLMKLLSSQTRNERKWAKVTRGWIPRRDGQCLTNKADACMRFTVFTLVRSFDSSLEAWAELEKELRGAWRGIQAGL